MSGNFSPDAVRDLAYRLWRERGDMSGSPEDDWLRAEAMLASGARADVHDAALDQVTGGGERQTATEVLDRAVEESFPASDPLAIHSNDEPPANAAAKWEAAKSAKVKGPKRG